MPAWKGNWLMRPGLLAKDQPPTWTDWEGVERRVPKWDLCFTTDAHDRLRNHVWRRDGYACQGCGRLSNGHGLIEGPDDGIADQLCIDHVISQRNGGGNHPDNLQSLCRKCNAVKVGVVDKAQHPELVPFRAEFSLEEMKLLDEGAKRAGLTRKEALRVAVRRHYTLPEVGR